MFDPISIIFSFRYLHPCFSWSQNWLVLIPTGLWTVHF